MLARLVGRTANIARALGSNVAEPQPGFRNQLEVGVGFVNKYAQALGAAGGVGFFIFLMGTWTNDTKVNLARVEAEAKTREEAAKINTQRVEAEAKSREEAAKINTQRVEAEAKINVQRVEEQVKSLKEMVRLMVESGVHKESKSVYDTLLMGGHLKPAMTAEEPSHATPRCGPLHAARQCHRLLPS